MNNPNGQRQTPTDEPAGGATPTGPIRRLVGPFWQIGRTFFNAEQWERHERDMHETRRRRRLFFEYLAVASLVMAVVLLLTLTKKSSNPLESRVQDWVMEWFAENPNDVDYRHFPQILFFDVDEASWRDPAWGGGEPRAVPLSALAKLIDRAVGQGAKYVLTDFAVDGPTDKDMTDFYDAVKTIVDRTIQEGRDCRFLFVRSIRTPLPGSQDPPLIRPSYALDRLMAEYPDRVHAVSTNFVKTTGVVRYWRLWESAVLEKPGQHGQAGEKVWATLPAAQLLIQALEKGMTAGGRPLPWTPESLLAPPRDNSADGPAPLAADNACGAITADFHMGHWIRESFGRCYQQDHFTGQDCRAVAPDCGRRSAGLKKRENRVFFYWTDFYWEQGGQRLPFRHLYHVPARELWRAADTSGDPPEESRAIARMRRFSERVGRNGDGAPPPGVAIIGGTYTAGNDFHASPTGKMLPGTLLLANAIATMTLHGPIQEMGFWPSMWATLGMVVLFSASLTWVAAWFALWRDGWFNARHERVVGWCRARVEGNRRFRLLGMLTPKWLRDRVAAVVSWTPSAQSTAFWVVIAPFFLLTCLLLAEWKIWFNFTLTLSFMYCLLEIRSTALWQAFVMCSVVQLLL